MGGGRLTDRWKEKQQTDAEEKMADQFGFEKERNSSLRTPRLLIRTYCKEEHIKRLKFESLYVLGQGWNTVGLCGFVCLQLCLSSSAQTASILHSHKPGPEAFLPIFGLSPPSSVSSLPSRLQPKSSLPRSDKEKQALKLELFTVCNYEGLGTLQPWQALLPAPSATAHKPSSAKSASKNWAMTQTDWRFTVQEGKNLFSVKRFRLMCGPNQEIHSGKKEFPQQTKSRVYSSELRVHRETD